MANERVYVRGCGIVSAIGTSQPQLINACLENRVQPPLINTSLSDAPIAYYAITPEVHAARSNRLYQFIDAAVLNAIEDAALNKTELENTAVFSGSTACDISDLEEHYQNDLDAKRPTFPLYRSGFGVLAGYVADKYQLGGQEYSFNTACSSSANAFMTAAHMIQAGRFDHAIVLGVEVFNQMSFQGFQSMMLLSPDICRPFDAKRNGTLLGEAVGAVVLSRQPPSDSQFSGDHPFYFLSGANLCDTKSVTSSNADVIAAVMRQALHAGNLNPNQIDAIKAHGTSTQNNDSAEGLAMKEVFADSVSIEGIPPFTSLKPYLGHTLGACGVVEMILMLVAINQGFIPRTPTFETIDPQLGIEPLREHSSFTQGALMLNYFGFGGNNSTLILANNS